MPRGAMCASGLAAALLCACGGASPLMHPAHVLGPNDVDLGAGFASEFSVASAVADSSPTAERLLHEATVAPGLSPWLAARLGLDEGFEAGLGYTGRTMRIDARRAFELGAPTLSAGLGASLVLPRRHDDLGFRVGGGGADLPLLLGFRSDADIFAGWIGARGGFEWLDGQRDLEVAPDAPLDTPTSEEVSGLHGFVGGLLGLRVGFRYVHAVLEIDAAMHWASGDVGAESVAVRQLGLSPAGALVAHF